VTSAVRPALAAAMSRHAGVARDRRGLERLRQVLDQARPAPGRLDLAMVEATNLHGVSALVVAAALGRPESRGCHRWRDTPAGGTAGPARHTLVRADAGQPWSRGSVQTGVGASA
jgi:L-aspartate oxidase